MQTKNPTLLSVLLIAVSIVSAHNLAQAQTTTPHIIVTAPPGTRAQVVSVETRQVSPTEVQIGDPTFVAPAPAAPVVVATAPTLVPGQGAGAQEDIHLHIDLRLRLENTPPPAAPNVAPVVVAPMALPAPPDTRLNLEIEAPRRRYGLPITLLAAGGITTILGGMTAAFDEELVFVPAIGAGLFISGAITMIIRVSRFRRARREHARRQSFDQTDWEAAAAQAPAMPAMRQPAL